MSAPLVAAAPASPARRPLSPARRNLRAFLRHRGGVLGAGLVLCFLLVALTADLVAPYDPLAQDLTRRLQPPSGEHWLGTDDFGRDVLSRVLHGSRVSLRLGIVAVLVALVVGGTMRAYWGTAMTPTAIIALVRDGPRMATTTIDRRIEGKASMRSMTRMPRRSKAPP